MTAQPSMFTIVKGGTLPPSVTAKQSISDRLLDFLDKHEGKSFMACDLHGAIAGRDSEVDSINSALHTLKKAARIKAFRDPAVSHTRFFYTSSKSANPVHAPVQRTAPAPAPAAPTLTLPVLKADPKPLVSADLNAVLMGAIEARAQAIAEQLVPTLVAEKLAALEAEAQVAVNAFASAMTDIFKRYTKV